MYKKRLWLDWCKGGGTSNARTKHGIDKLHSTLFKVDLKLGGNYLTENFQILFFILVWIYKLWWLNHHSRRCHATLLQLGSIAIDLSHIQWLASGKIFKINLYQFLKLNFPYCNFLDFILNHVLTHCLQRRFQWSISWITATTSSIFSDQVVNEAIFGL